MSDDEATLVAALEKELARDRKALQAVLSELAEYEANGRSMHFEAEWLGVFREN
jgi:hypothetical protein